MPITVARYFVFKIEVVNTSQDFIIPIQELIPFAGNPVQIALDVIQHAKDSIPSLKGKVSEVVNGTRNPFNILR